MSDMTCKVTFHLRFSPRELTPQASSPGRGATPARARDFLSLNHRDLRRPICAAADKLS